MPVPPSTQISVGIAVTVVGGVLLYWAKQRLKANRLRRAIATEIRSTPVGAFKTSLLGIPALETPVIEANLDRLDLLTQEELAHVRDYRRHMVRVREHNERESDEDRVSISVRLTEEGDRKSTRTAALLEERISRPFKYWAAAKRWLRQRRGNTIGFTPFEAP
jgi:hypothetical protein